MRLSSLAISLILLSGISPVLAQTTATPVKPAVAKPAPVKKAPAPVATPVPTATPVPADTPIPSSVPVAAPAAKLYDRFYADMGVPALFSYNTSPALDPALNGGRKSNVPNGSWASGLGINIGFEKAIDNHFAAVLEMGLMTMDVNQALVKINSFPPTQAAVLLNMTLGLKISSASEKPINPYFTIALGCSSIRISSFDMLTLGVIVPKYEGLRFLARAAAGIDIRCDEEMTAYLECQFDDMDTLHLVSHGPDVSMCLFKSGLRMAL